VTVSIGSATPAQFAAILEFWAEATEVPSSTDDLDGLSTLHKRDPDALLVATDGGAVVGTLIAAWDGWRAAFYRMAVRPDRRRLGIGRALVAEGEARLRRRGARRLSLYAVASHRPAMEFWLSLGYRPDPEEMRLVRNLTDGDQG
jgi:ribosomal protein S18 acetylase RimI-like enzyme